MIQLDIALFVFSLFAKYSIISFLVIIPINTLLSSTTGTKFWLVAFSKSSSIETCMLTALLSLFRSMSVIGISSNWQMSGKSWSLRYQSKSPSVIVPMYFPYLSKRGMAEYPWNSIFSTTCLSVSSLNICDTFSFGVKKNKMFINYLL